MPDNAAGNQFGLIGALVGAAVTNAQVKKAEQRVTELRNLLIDYPFNARMEQVLRDRLAAGDIVGPAGITVLQATWDPDSTGSASLGDAVILAPRYSILNNFEQLSVKLTLSHVERTAATGKKPRQKLLYSRTYVFQFPLSKVAGSGPDEDAMRWIGFGRDALEGMLDLGIEQVADMLAYDLSAEGRAEAEQPCAATRPASARARSAAGPCAKVMAGSGCAAIR